ncbi:MAG: methylmalonyl Co-A mutase-associated GTPase MeaB [Betaproteobacteria bacterium]|nr:methylmalonyl Co-A mutase-associated GTPase MeaB [Betaproteobacteria bacterium]
MKRDATAVGAHARPDVALRLAAIRAGERAAIARAITAIENDIASARALSAALAADAGRAHVVGVTGPPGAGKSTLINALLAEFAARGRRIAVVAIDPSSPITGGAVLGDRVRMHAAGAAESVFIRSLASRGHAGGLAKATRRIVDLLDAAGFDAIVVETVGAGQSDVGIAALADTSVVVCPPGLGDDVQAIKAGILEIADVLVVNKGDQPAADRTEQELRDMLRLRAHRPGWAVRVLRTVATTGDGVPALVDALDAHATDAGRGRRLARAPAPPAATAVESRLRGFCAADPYQRLNALEFVESGPGTVTMRMRVAPQHLNFNGKCHGGAIFTLADSAFGVAANAYGVVAAGIDTHTTFQVAVSEGDVLTARSLEVSRNAKIAVYRVDVTRGDGTVVASFTGTVFMTRRPHQARPDDLRP